MDLNKAVLCGRLQQTGLGRAPGTLPTPLLAGQAGGTSWGGGSGERPGREGTSGTQASHLQPTLSARARCRALSEPGTLSAQLSSPILDSGPPSCSRSLRCEKALSKLQIIQVLADLKSLSRSDSLGQCPCPLPRGPAHPSPCAPGCGTVHALPGALGAHDGGGTAHKRPPDALPDSELTLGRAHTLCVCVLGASTS